MKLAGMKDAKDPEVLKAYLQEGVRTGRQQDSEVLKAYLQEGAWTGRRQGSV